MGRVMKDLEDLEKLAPAFTEYLLTLELLTRTHLSKRKSSNLRHTLRILNYITKDLYDQLTDEQ
jgi:hypothetical protein